MRVLARPAFKSRLENPYNWLLYTSMQKLGIHVDESSLSRCLQNQYSIWHLHWPELPLNQKNHLKAFLKIRALLHQMDWARSRGTKVIWTVHNLTAHEQHHPDLEAWFWQAFTHRLDGYISLTQAGMNAAQERFPALTTRPGFIIPHGHYRGEYPDHISDRTARASLGIPPTAKVLLFFGRIRTYKNAPELIKTFRQLADPDAILYIVGRPECPALAAELQQQAALDTRVRLHLDFVPKDKTQLYFHSADLVILPYREILNSGSALLALSFNRPVLVPLRGAMSELQAQVGQEWVHTYPQELVTGQIQHALQWAFHGSRPQQAPLAALDWQKLAEQTLNAYQVLQISKS
jgi:glycosyltransferase involved in cell wall biosynthesis